MMRYLNLRGRDNARTPMQWDDTASAGFTTGTPWIKVGPDYETVNAKNEMADPDSVYNYYKKLIHLRKRRISWFTERCTSCSIRKTRHCMYIPEPRRSETPRDVQFYKEEQEYTVRKPLQEQRY